MNARPILDKKKFAITIDRLCYELIEVHGDFSNTALIGLQPRGIFLAKRLHKRISEILNNNNILYGELDIAFYRDDFRRNDTPILPSELKIDFSVEGKDIILIDDVLYTGRTIRAALDALSDFGRPSKVELLVLIDRRHSRHLPIQPDYFGMVVDSRANDKVKVEWKETHKDDIVHIVTNE
jgi:pyrimidine operon attenuation protein/uracil phosphoribosyltransferase